LPERGFWDSQSKFRIKIGPVNLQEFKAFVPLGSAFRPTTDLLRLVAGPEFDFDLQLVVKAEEVPACRLASLLRDGPGSDGLAGSKTREFAQDDEQVCYL